MKKFTRKSENNKKQQKTPENHQISIFTRLGVVVKLMFLTI